MIDKTAIYSHELDMGWKTQKLIISLKTAFCQNWVDARKWRITPENIIPGEGIFLKATDWPIAIEHIQKILETARTDKTPLNSIT